jgi:hypothetical protein
MTHQDVLQPARVLHQVVVQGNDRSAGIAEHPIDAVAKQSVDNDAPARPFGIGLLLRFFIKPSDVAGFCGHDNTSLFT